MILKLLTRTLLLLFCLQPGWIRAADADPQAATTETAERLRLMPGRDDGRIAFATARLLEQWHYSHLRFDDNVSSQFLDRYVEWLDPQHLCFLQSDLAAFESYRTNLDNLTVTRRGVADVMPAYEIFSRFFERLEQRVNHVDELLKNEEFTFDAAERIVLNRSDLPHPKDLDEARQLWRQRLRYEYLQEKLALETGKKDATVASTNSPAEIREQIVHTLSRRYHRTLRLYADWNNDDLLGAYLTALANVYDPHSDYLNRAQLESFAISMNLQLFGIGAELLSDDGYCKIQRLLPGGPAGKSGKINAGDRIVAVAQADGDVVDVVDMSLSKIVQMIRGPKGTEVRLTLMPAGTSSSARTEVTLIRDEIPLDDQAAKGKIIELPNEQGKKVRLGIIDLPSFYASMDLGRGGVDKDGDARRDRFTAPDVTKLLKKFKEENVSGVILDLRRNGGGSLEEAINVTGLFITQGPVVQVCNSDGSVIIDEDKDPSVAYDGPLMVLTSRFSASASEIVAGALQDYGRAIIVGDSSTHGKGTVQTVQNLNSFRAFMRLSDADSHEPGALKVTIRKFYRASGASTQLKGVMPDIVLPSILNYSKEIGEAALENPLPWDVIPGATYDKLDLVEPHLSELLRRSSERIATNQDFVYVREDIEHFREQQADKTVSLNEKERLDEMAKAETRQKARDDERRSRPESRETVYEITLKQAELPGLPPPMQKTNVVTANLRIEGGSATNSAAITTTASTASAEDEDEEKAPAIDAEMMEAQRILLDYLSVLPAGESLLVTH